MSTDFTGRIAYVAGGCGAVGKGIVRAFLEHGCRVIVTSKSQERLTQLRKEFEEELVERLTLMKADISTEQGVDRFAKEIINRFGKIHHVVSSLGAWWEKGTLSEQPYKEFLGQVENLAGSHFLIAKTFLPELNKLEGTTYTFITGVAGENCLLPEASLISVGAACLYGVSLAARAEFQRKNVAVCELRVGARVDDKNNKDVRRGSRSGAASSSAGQNDVSNDKIGELVVAMSAARCRELQRADTAQGVDVLLKLYNRKLID